MAHDPYIDPEYAAGSFTCPHCHTHTGQAWLKGWTYGVKRERGVVLSECQSTKCNQIAIWLGRPGTVTGEGMILEFDVASMAPVMIWPRPVKGPTPNEDLNEDIINDLEEARKILDDSPRGAAALARLAIQKLCIQMSLPGKDLNKDIGALVAAGLSPLVQQALDVVRVTGNESVHPGIMDIGDDPGVAIRLLELVNLVADELVSRPARVAEMFASLPKEKLDGIASRDA